MLWPIGSLFVQETAKEQPQFDECDYFAKRMVRPFQVGSVAPCLRPGVLRGGHATPQSRLPDSVSWVSFLVCLVICCVTYFLEQKPQPSTAQGKTTQAFLKLSSRPCVSVSLHPDATMADLKGMVRKLFSLPDDCAFYLLHAGHCLSKDALVSGHGLQPGDTIHVIMKGLGGGGGGEATSRFPEGSSAHTTPEDRGGGMAAGKFWD